MNDECWKVRAANLTLRGGFENCLSLDEAKKVKNSLENHLPVYGPYTLLCFKPRQFSGAV